MIQESALNAQTGRTQRMLEAAVERAKQGVWVAVIAASERHMGHLYDRLLQFDGADPTNRKNGKVYFSVDNYAMKGSVSVIVPTGTHDRFNWRTGQLEAAHPLCEVFADHYAIENEMGWALQEWHRWSESE